ncbi:MAG: hypothetical protein QXQ64_07650, partial [Candidatus Bathyarchaeia archaeon]
MRFSQRLVDRCSPNVWLFDVLRDSGVAADVSYNGSQVVVKASRSGLCVACKGSRFLCGKTRCPIIVRANYFLKSVPLMQSEDIAGASPPSVFVGRIGYPYVYA